MTQVEKGPDAFRTISEAATELGVPSHVLRFWETKFSFIRPMKRAGGRRFYRKQDLAVLRGVRALLHEEGYTIKGVQRLHKEHGLRRLVAAGDGEAAGPDGFAPELEAALDADATSDGDFLDRDQVALLEESEPEPVEPLALKAVQAAPEPRNPVLGPDARRRLLDVLADLESAKAEIDALLPESAD